MSSANGTRGLSGSNPYSSHVYLAPPSNGTKRARTNSRSTQDMQVADWLGTPTANLGAWLQHHEVATRHPLFLIVAG